MKYIFTGKGMEVSDSLKARVEKKLNKLDRYFREEAEDYGDSRFGTEADHRGTARLCGGALYPGEPSEDQGDPHEVRREEAHRASGKPV